MYTEYDSFRPFLRFLPAVRTVFCDFAAFFAPFALGFGGMSIDDVEKYTDTDD
jgi:hypothetical protein